MGAPRLNLKVSKTDFENRISIVDVKIALLDEVITDYMNARESLDNFIDGSDSNYQNMIERIEVNVKAARKAKAALERTKQELQDTVNKMEGMAGQVKNTITAATSAALEVVETKIKIDSVL